MPRTPTLPTPLARRLVFGDAEQIAAIRTLPRIIDPGAWCGLRVRFRPGWPRYAYVDVADPETIRIADEIAAGRAVVVEDHTRNPDDGRVLVRTAEGEMWCSPEDLQEVIDAASNDDVANGLFATPPSPRKRWRATVTFVGTREYEVEARTREGAIRQARALAADDEPEEWEPIDDVEVEEA